MKTDLEKTTVIFRQFRKGGDIIALFPELPGSVSPSTCLSYQFIGQHGIADFNYVVQATRLCNPTNYKPLQDELESLGYNLRIVKRCSSKMRLKCVYFDFSSYPDLY